MSVLTVQFESVENSSGDSSKGSISWAGCLILRQPGSPGCREGALDRRESTGPIMSPKSRAVAYGTWKYFVGPQVSEFRTNLTLGLMELSNQLSIKLEKAASRSPVEYMPWSFILLCL